MDFDDIWIIFLRFCVIVCFVILRLIVDRQDKLEKRIDNLEQSLRTKDRELEGYLIKEKQK